LLSGLEIMRDSDFAKWLRDVYKTGKGTSLEERPQGDAISRCRRVERYEGDLDKNFLQDNLKRILSRLECPSGITTRHDIPINGNPKTGTSSLKNAITLYRSFCMYSKPKV
jgi:hypothetical protein